MALVGRRREHSLVAGQAARGGHIGRTVAFPQGSVEEWNTGQFQLRLTDGSFEQHDCSSRENKVKRNGRSGGPTRSQARLALVSGNRRSEDS